MHATSQNALDAEPDLRVLAHSGHLDKLPGTRYHQLCCSNEPPLQFDIPVIEAVAAGIDARLKTIDVEIARLESQLQELREERKTLGTRREQNRAILSPVRRIPPELLIEIFCWTLPYRWERPGRIEVIESPWVLTHICSRWRALALFTPALWLRVVILYSSKYSSTYPLQLVETQAQRAKQLEIVFEGDEALDWQPQLELFQCLTNYAEKWVELRMILTSKLCPVLPTLRDRLPSLRKLWLGWNSPQIAIESINCFGTAPSLVDVGVHYNDTYIPVLLPLHQLTRYSLEASWDVHLNILKLAPNLVEVRIMIHFDDEPWPQNGAIIHLLTVRRLYVQHTEILDCVITPVLEELAIYRIDGDEREYLQGIGSLFRRSSCPLQELCIAGTPNAEETIDILHEIPSIISLGIMVNEETLVDEVDTLIKRLTFSPLRTPVASYLTRLFFGCEYETAIDYELYLAMITSRWKAENSGLRSTALVVEDGPRPGHQVTQELRALQDDGLDLLLLTGEASKEFTDEWAYA